MTGSRPLNGSVRSSNANNGSNLAPNTPRGHASKQVNDFIQSIAQEFGLPLKRRDDPFSPSKRPDDNADNCVSCINFLFFRNRVELDNIVTTFRKDCQDGHVHQDIPNDFYCRIRDAFYLEKNKPVLKINLTPQPPLRVPVLRKPTGPNSLKQTRLDPRSWKTSGSKDVINGNSKPEDRIVESVLPRAQTDPEASTRGTKRPSNQVTTQSPKYVRSSKKRRSIKDHFFSRKDSATNSSFGSESFQKSAQSLFSVSNNGSFASTKPSSFGSESGESLDNHESSSIGYEELDPSQIDRLMLSFDQPKSAQNSSFVGPPTDCTRPTSPVVDAGASDVRLLEEHTTAIQAPCLESGKNSPVHRLARSLPNDGLFSAPTSDEMLSTMSTMPFALRWEWYRAAALFGEPLQSFRTPTELYDHVREMSGPSGSFQKTAPPIWDALRNSKHTSDVVYKGNLTFSTSASSKTLYSLTLQPLQREGASVLQRTFGSDRFLYLEVPQISSATLPAHVRGQVKVLKDQFQKWTCTEKEFLGRKWRAFHIQDVKKKHTLSKHPSQRLVLFAVDGPDLEPISITRLLNWAIPLSRNSNQSFCKAYARLDLFLSQTTPTVVFKPSEVRFVEDKKADGTPECARFNDPRAIFKNDYNPFSRAVMDDGCSILSVGAAKEVCELLGITGCRPVSFQCRINGCKGVWTISAPYDTTDSAHQTKWIQITKSQCKVEPRAEDLNDATCEPGRWSLEVVKYTSAPKTSALNVEFIPILENRHVSWRTLHKVIERQMEMDFTDFLKALDEPVALRRWLHSQFGTMEEVNRSSGVRQMGSVPADSVERAVSLIESGFDPTQCRYLADTVRAVVDLWLVQMRQKLRIRLGKSTMTLGIADPTGCLMPGEIHMAFSETFRDETSNEAWSHLKGEVLVARHPSLRNSDLQKVRAVYKEELSHLTDVVVFPSKGCIPLAHKLQGGDYDGDTFWICWDGDIAQPFMNAPAPSNTPSLDLFSIRKDSRTLGEVIGSSALPNVDNWLSESFKFKLQEDLLGQVTNFHKRLAYKENTISSSNVDALADLHDLIIDSAKNGYTFTFDAFKKCTREKLGIKREPPRPAYETWMKPKENDEDETPRNLNHIIDYLLFKVVNPSMKQLKKDCEEKLEKANTTDTDLELPFRNRQKSENATIKEVLKKLTIDVAKVPSIGGSFTKMPSEIYHNRVRRVCEAYNAIQPLHADDSIIKEWLTRDVAHMPSTWDIIKASVFYTERHRTKALPFLVAGRTLCFVKAGGGRAWGSGVFVVVGEVYNVYKPRKEKGKKKMVLGVRDGKGGLALGEGVGEGAGVGAVSDDESF